MMDAVHDTVYPWTHIRRALRNVGKYEKETFPTFVHSKGAMGCIAMMKKRLRKEGQVPMKNKKNNDDYHVHLDFNE